MSIDTDEWHKITPTDFVSVERIHELVEIAPNYPLSAVLAAIRDAVYAARHSIVIERASAVGFERS
jgi:hypothetical protein